MNQHTRMGALVLALAFALPAMAALRPAAAEAAVPANGESFATPEAAVAALIDTLRRGDQAAIAATLGPGTDKLLSSGDAAADAEARRRFLAAYDEKHALVADGPDRMVLQVGANDWPLPLPLVKTEGGWRFDSRIGAQELVDRRIGRNEIAAIRTALAFVDAEKLYFAMASHDGAGEYAQRLISSPGKHDGLYWPPAGGEPDSPLAPLIAQASDAGYPGELVSGRQMPYEGYYFRILRGQGPDAPGGVMDYVVHGRMTKGFALVAWPASYGASGIMTFLVNQDGVVFQKDLGEHTAAVAGAMQRFNPDLSWARVDVVNQ
ncbi:MAG TPA: DUF2950 domain-containing protein [Acetobacteraceae bacterium]|nr:DUF2950 domain-containing protein [Acetobacteraceae bacterium]